MLALFAGICFFAWIWLIYGQGNFWRLTLPMPPRLQPSVWPNVAIIVPARNEAEILPQTLPSLLAQDYAGGYRVILVDDQSSDGTAAWVAGLAATQPERLQLIEAPSLPRGWSGKLHALQTGLQQSDWADYVLFTDADIHHTPSSLRFLVARALESDLDLHSQMVRLRCESLWEKLLIPAFVYFFAMLYPFNWCNDPQRKTAAAAGGVMLMKRQALQEIGGLDSIRGALIDDCALARAIKSRRSARPPRILLTLAEHGVTSVRPYDTLTSLWQMIRRSAFTQLRYSYLLLGLTLLAMTTIFILPPIFVFSSGLVALSGWIALAAMIISYAPIVKFYRLFPLWVVTLPLAAIIFLGATLDSARHYAQGRGGQWKGRVQAAGPSS
jgi:hopene-associated glycosyltransferase HpnB